MQDIRINVVSPSFQTVDNLSADELYDFLLRHDEHLKSLAEKLKNERVCGVDLLNFEDSDYENFSATYGEKKKLKLLIQPKKSSSNSTSTASTPREPDLSRTQNELNQYKDIAQKQEQEIQQKNKIIQELGDAIVKKDQQIQQQDLAIKQLQAVVQKQSQQVVMLMGLMNQKLCPPGPPPENSFEKQAPTVKDQLTNVPANIAKIPIVPPGSPNQNIPNIQPNVPTAIHLGKNTQYAPASKASLPTSSEGPNSSNVKFPTIYHPDQEALFTQPVIEDIYNINNYGTYKVTIYSEDSQHIITETMINVIPDIHICVPKRFVVRDSIDNLVKDGIVTLKRVGENTVVFTGRTDQTGTITLPDVLADGAYEVEIHPPDNSKLQHMKFFMVIFQSKRKDTDDRKVPRGDLKSNEIEIVLDWKTGCQDLDSHLFASDGKHIYYQNMCEENMSLDCDHTDGHGPETIKFIMQPNLKYVYAVHNFSGESMLTYSKADVIFSLNESTTQIKHVGKQDKLTNLEVHKIPEITRPQARFWVVCMIDGLNKRIKFFENIFEEHNDYATNTIGAKYFVT